MNLAGVSGTSFYVGVPSPTAAQNEITLTCAGAASVGAVFSGAAGTFVVGEMANAGWITGTAAMACIATAGIVIPFILIGIAAWFAVNHPNARC